MGEAVVIGQLPHLLVGRVGEALLAEAEGRAPQAGEPFDIALAVVVDDIDAVPAGDDPGA